jgi:uncharacterized membrane protein YkvA (DUF1232 family)
LADVMDRIPILNQPTFDLAQQDSGVRLTWKQTAQQLQKEVQIFYFVVKHPKVPWYARLVAACIAGYVFSPIQLIPSFIPVIGIVDDLLVFFLGARLLRKIIPRTVFSECRALADAATVRSEEQLRSPTAITAFVVVTAVWLLAAIRAGVLMATYVFR